MRLFKIYALLFFFLVCGADSFSQSGKIQHAYPANGYLISGLCYGSVTYFTNTTQSTSPPTYTWTVYEQGNATPVLISNAVNINFTFPNRTTYTVQLDANNGHLSTLIRVFNIDTITKSAFEFQNCQSIFSNLSACSNSCIWDFGDGTTSTQNSPVHYFPATGLYTVTLVANNGSKSDTSKQVVSAFHNDLSGEFTYTVEKDSVLFLAADSTVAPTSIFHWAFGDGSVADLYTIPYGKKIRHHYKKTGRDSTYKVFLLLNTLCFNAFSEQDIFIHDSTLVTGTSIYPNPVEDDILRVRTVLKQTLSNIKIFNSLGQSLSDWYVIDKSQGFDINLSSLPPGVYVLRLDFSDYIITHKIVKD